MMKKNPRAIENLNMLELTARRLGKLNDEFIFVGGCTTALFITDPAIPDIRTTLDVDCIVDVLSLGDYYKLENRLRQQGFKKSMEDDVICRWHYDDLILDVMPTDEKILGFGNRWYKAALNHTIIRQLTEDLAVKSVTAPYFLAKKWEAFKTRGKNDYLMSHDFEDIITIIDGRIELANEIKSTDTVLKKHLQKVFSDLLKTDNFSSYLPGHLNYGAATQPRTKTVLNRIKKIANTIEE